MVNDVSCSSLRGRTGRDGMSGKVIGNNINRMAVVHLMQYLKQLD
jgi:hypothetical protein